MRKGNMIETTEKPWEIERYKLVILGDATVGKSSIVASYTMGKDLSYVESTLVASFTSIYLDKSVRFDTWEVAGQERWRDLAPIYYRGAQAALIVYDVQNPESLNIAKGWIEELRKKIWSLL
ncbi:ras-related protein Rab-5A-like isoform X2 [Drosophila innubila]|uniref:ras-related protein Rab-5A-like isoform X2 n=1 Tax=Drosophila innubila TaxID=198719 RepID=UPI00148D7043|nr:ras-related protein Rab-5A-like isoform X2 [Drosophila innubila]